MTFKGFPLFAAMIAWVAYSPSTSGIFTSMKTNFKKFVQQVLLWSALNMSIAYWPPPACEHWTWHMSSSMHSRGINSNSESSTISTVFPPQLEQAISIKFILSTDQSIYIYSFCSQLIQKKINLFFIDYLSLQPLRHGRIL